MISSGKVARNSDKLAAGRRKDRGVVRATAMVRVYLGRDSTTGKRRYRNKTVHGTKKDSERYRNKVRREKPSA